MTSPASSLRPFSRAVVQKVEAIATPEGKGAVVRRSIGTPSLRNLTPFLMLDHFTIGEGAGFPDHPHRGQTTWTYMLDGWVRHEDFHGHQGEIGPGDLQWMSGKCERRSRALAYRDENVSLTTTLSPSLLPAGKGIMHAEMPKHYDSSGKRLPDPVGLQLWVDLPKAAKSSPAQYQEMRGSSLPTAVPRSSEPPETEGADWSVKVIAGRSHGVESPVRSPENGGTWFLDVRLHKPGAKVFQEIPEGWTAFAYTLGPAPVKIGSAEGGAGPGASASQDIHAPYHTLVFDANPGSNGVWIEHAGTDESQEARLMLYAAQPLDQEVYQYGPFVLSEKEGIQKALLDFRMGINGFENAPGWKSKIGGR